MSSNLSRPMVKNYTKMSQSSDRRDLKDLTLLGTDDITVDDDDQLSAESFGEEEVREKHFLEQKSQRGLVNKIKTSALEP